MRPEITAQFSSLTSLPSLLSAKVASAGRLIYRAYCLQHSDMLRQKDAESGALVVGAIGADSGALMVGSLGDAMG